MSITTISHQLVGLYYTFTCWINSVVKGGGLSSTQANTIEVIDNNHELSMIERAERLGVTIDTHTIGIDKLEKKGLFERSPHQQDSCSRLVVLTSKSREVFEQHQRLYFDFPCEISTGHSFNGC